MEITSTKIKKTGKNIRKRLLEGLEPNQEQIDIIQQFRISHQEALSFTFDRLVANITMAV